MPAVNRITKKGGVIAAGQSLSTPLYFGAGQITGVKLPAAWTAASITFQSSYDKGATWQEVYDDGGNEIVSTPAPNMVTPLDPGSFAGLVYLRVRSGTLAAPVAQAAKVTVQFTNRILGYAD